MGRWSAAHWKTATFGWLAFVLVAFAIGGAVGTKTIDPNAAGPGESGRMDRILDAGFKQPAGESVLVQSRSLRASDPAFTAAVEDVVAAISKVKVVQNVRSPFDHGQRRSDRARTGTRLSSSSRSAATRTRPPTRSARSSTASTTCRRPTRRSSSASSATRARSTASRPPTANDLGEGRSALAAGHAAHPRGRLRSARGSGHSAAPRPDRCLRHVRPDRDAQPPASDGACRRRRWCS